MKGRPTQEVLGLRFDRLPVASHAALALTLAALWLLGRRYGGITLDASIYVLQGLRVLDPASFARDLFFLHGAQDAYTIFPRIYALLIDVLGAGNAAVTVTIAGQVAFFAAAAALVFRIAAGPVRWWSLALLAVVSGYYGGVGVFRFAEPFATARTLAEPLVIAAFASMLASRHRLAFAALAAAALLHPLVAATGIAVVFLWHAGERHRIFWAVPLLIASVAALAMAWPGLMLSFDASWLAAVLERSPHLFISQWLLPDWSRFLWGFCVAWMAWRFVDAPVRRLVLAAAAIGLAGVAASWIAVDVLDNAFAAGLQLWRTHWLLHFIAIALVPVAGVGLWRSGHAARAAAACLAASCCFGRAELPASAVLVALAVVLDASERSRPGWMDARVGRLLLLGALGAASAGLLFEIQSRWPGAYGATGSAAWKDYVHAAASVGGLMPLAVVLWLAACSRFRVAALALAAAALALGLAAWDARTPWARFVEQASGGANPFRERIAPRAVVFWPGPHGKSWLLLGRPTWFSADQGAGIVFHRQTAIEFASRKLAASDLLSAIGNCSVIEARACCIDARRVREMCEREDGPDYLVLNAVVEGHAAVEWRLPAELEPGRQSLYLYACRVFTEK